ncbi:hypothetical protein MN608_07907 [Microdochium nivale]|nr:hypothetical protein MN608_07907 [Microdochium nivale]
MEGERLVLLRWLRGLGLLGPSSPLQRSSRPALMTTANGGTDPSWKHVMRLIGTKKVFLVHGLKGMSPVMLEGLNPSAFRSTSRLQHDDTRPCSILPWYLTKDTAFVSWNCHTGLCEIPVLGEAPRL